MIPSRHLARLADALSALTLLAVVVLLFAVEPRWSVFSLVGDDAGYYLHLARNVSLGFGFSFDRLEPSNGFNPLFPWLLIPIFRIAGAPSVDAAYRLGALVDVLAMLASLVLFARLVRGVLPEPRFAAPERRAVVAGAIAFYALFVCTKSYYGMDAPLVLLIGNAYLLRVMGHGLLAPGVRAAFLDGALLGLAFLARVDSLPLAVAAFGLMILSSAIGRGAWTGVALRAVAFVALAAPYLVWGYSTFGTWLPISARIKSAFPDLDLGRSLEAIRHTSLHVADQASFLLAFVLALFGCAWLARQWLDRRLAQVLGPGPGAVIALLSVYLAGRFAYMLMFSRNDVQGSYAILAHVFNVLVLVAGLAALGGRAAPETRARLASLTAAALLLIGLVLFAGKLQVTSDRWRRMAAGEAVDDATIGREIGAATQPTDILYGGAFGIAGLFADRAWINGDGVINTLDYQKALRDRRLREYLDHRSVTHVVHVVPPGRNVSEPVEVRVRSGLFGTSDALHLK
ncbi:MAG TPA: hypothetical protein VEY91_08510, partial [Candidatus Limnocylindria bacterium]|nr:hypothetical protein [Candidatus Limnocylindria bacterium]